MIRLRLASAVAAVLLGSLLLAACASEPLTRDEVDGPEALVIPPDLIGEQDLEGADAEAGEGQGEASERGGELPVDAAQTVPSRLVEEGPRLELEMGLNEAWRATGSALDRLEFTVLERVRDDLRYVIRYAPRADEEIEQPGLLARWFGGAERIDTAPQRYRIQLDQGDDAQVTVRVDDREGDPAPEPIAERLLTLLDRQLY
ncbi:MAG: outer membrane protein assembly factor BamC [Halorhodospira sp.]